MKRRTAILAALIVVALVAPAIFAVTALLSDRGDGAGPEIAPLLAVAESFPVPPGATIAFPDHTSEDPLQVVKGWNASGSLDEACQTWRDAFRLWLGEQNQHEVAGQLTENVSCTFSAPKDGYASALVVATYSAAPPLVTLQVSAQPPQP